jgi:16S rRNA (guanine(966)-N(2))-methyltransferase RsmD
LEASKIFHFASPANRSTMKKGRPPRDDAEPAAGTRRHARDEARRDVPDVAGLRVIGGSLRGRKITYSGDPRTRPMKDRTREAIYNLLKEWPQGAVAVDLFAGTGALGIEALSRGAAHAAFLEKHFPTADMIRRNLAELQLQDRATVLAGDTFLQLRRMRRDGHTVDVARPWLVFCSPPYDFFVDRNAEMLALVDDVLALAPPDSTLVVEADDRFDFATLPDAEAWRVREYAPAQVGIYRKTNGNRTEGEDTSA